MDEERDQIRRRNEPVHPRHEDEGEGEHRQPTRREQWRREDFFRDLERPHGRKLDEDD
jgi:hypothetical protein